ncbi:MAG TPA: chemotaxis protein CheW, partial [Geobacterales bacterium]|nr:chemotaxis protein CheW [Geobacterales bacterium]
EGFLSGFKNGSIPEAPPSEAPQAPREEKSSDTVRARVQTLDTLVNLVGELIISRRRFEERNFRLRRLVEAAGTTPLAEELRRFGATLDEDNRYLDFLIQSLHAEAMALRMLPLETITGAFHRMVRDLAREQDKDIDFRVDGEQLELDRVLLELLKPMLLHMIRNSLDHGIERPEERQASGKPGRATITVSARPEGNKVAVTVWDDGRGVDPARVRQAAMRKGLIGHDEAQLLTDEEARHLIFRPGFSTSEIVTDISGRGVGMDVVKKHVELVKGNMELKSEVGRFTELTLLLPLTLSIIEALLVRVGEEQYLLPLAYVQETIRLSPHDLQTAGGRDVIHLRGATIPITPLASLLNIPARVELRSSDTLFAVILRFRDEVIAVSVDRCLGSQEIVVKGLGGQLIKVPCISGATILGDGDPTLIVAIPDLFGNDNIPAASSLREELSQAMTQQSRGRILVVDDSITTRTMEKSILVSRGFDVEVAVSAEDVLERLGDQLFDLVISDVEMPGLNGFDLCRRLRQLDTFRDVPVMIVSSLSKDEHKRQAIDAGAQAYIVKGEFEQGKLLETVEMLIG